MSAAEKPALPWTLRFTEWSCGHHGQRPDDIPCASPEQAKAILWAIACAISQPGSARAILFDETRGYPDIYITDDYASVGARGDCDFDKATQSERPIVLLCADQATVDALLVPELKEARESLVDLWLDDLMPWDGTSLVETWQSIATTMPRADVEALASVDETRLDPRPPLFELPPVFHDGAAVLERLQAEAKEIAEYEAERQREEGGAA